MKTVYLCGAIDAVTTEYAKGWRQTAKAELTKAGFTVIDPTDDMHHSLTTETVVRKDLASVEASDILLVEMNNHNGAYIGTSMEIRKAWEWGKRIIVWGEANLFSYFLNFHQTVRLRTLEEAVACICSGRLEEILSKEA